MRVFCENNPKPLQAEYCAWGFMLDFKKKIWEKKIDIFNAMKTKLLICWYELQSNNKNNDNTTIIISLNLPSRSFTL